MISNLRYFKLHPSAVDPVYSTLSSSCFDLSACLVDDERLLAFDSYNDGINVKVNSGKVKIWPHSRTLVPTGLIFELPPGMSLRLHPRSGLALKKGIGLANSQGVIDNDYVEQTFVAIINMSDQEFEISHGDRIAQGELFHDNLAMFEEVFERPTVRTNRQGGFGSTGIES